MRFSRIIAPLLLALCAIFVFVYQARGLAFKSFQVDEVLQYYTALGNHEFDLTKRGNHSLQSTLFHNFNDNLDPGGFTLILKGWSLISNNVTWLRVLPFFFYFSSIIVIYTAFSRKFPYFFTNLLFTLFIATHPLIMNWAFILRSYSFELLGISYLCLCTVRIKDKFNFSFIVVLLFIFSRYSFTVFLSTFLLSWLFIYRKERLNLTRTWPYFFLIVIVLLTASYILAEYYSPYLPGYLRDLTIGQAGILKSGSKWILERNMTSPYFIIFLITNAIYYFCKKRLSQPSQHIFNFSLFSHIVFITLSILGLHPWIYHERFNMGLELLSLFTFSVVILELITSLSKLSKKVCLLSLFLLVPIYKRVATFEFDPYTDILRAIKQIPLESPKEKSIFLSFNAFFETYFQFDVGEYRDQRELFAHFSGDRPNESLVVNSDYRYFLVSPLDRTTQFKIENQLRLKPIKTFQKTLLYRNE